MRKHNDKPLPNAELPFTVRYLDPVSKPTMPDEVNREALLEQCIRHLRRTPNDILVSYLPVLVKYAEKWGEPESVDEAVERLGLRVRGVDPQQPRAPRRRERVNHRLIGEEHR